MMLFLMDSEIVLTPRAQEFRLETPPKLANSYSERKPTVFPSPRRSRFPFAVRLSFFSFQSRFLSLTIPTFCVLDPFPCDPPTLFYYLYIHLNSSFFLSFTLLVIDSRPVAFELYL